MIRFFTFLLLSTVFVFSAEEYKIGDQFMYQGQKYEATYVSFQCDSNKNQFPELTKVNTNVWYINASTKTCNYGWTPYYYISAGPASGECDIDDRGFCYSYSCSDTMFIGDQKYDVNLITDSEVCLWGDTSSPVSTGNVWKSATECSAPTGSCYVKNNCNPISGHDTYTNATASDQCDVEKINKLLDPTAATFYFTEALWQECDSTCYVKTVPINCSLQIPFLPELLEDETIYSTELTLEQCVQYANSQNMDIRFEEYTTAEAPGFKCQDLKFCIIKDRSHNCAGIDTPLPTVSTGESYFIVDDQPACIQYGQDHSLSVQHIHFDDIDNIGNFCFNIDYCVVSGSENNSTSSENNNSYSSEIPNNIGTNTGTGVQATDSNGTNQRLDVLDGHIKDSSDILRYGFDRNHADLNQLSSDIENGSQMINRGINGLSHNIGNMLDQMKDDEVNNTSSSFDDSRIVAAENNTTNALLDIFGDSNISLTELNITDADTSFLESLMDEVLAFVDDLNVTKEELESEITESLQVDYTDFQDKGKTLVSDVLSEMFSSNLFNIMQPFEEVGKTESNFRAIDFPINITSIGYTDHLQFTFEDMFGAPGSALSSMFEMLQTVLQLISVLAGFFYLIKGVSDV